MKKGIVQRLCIVGLSLVLTTGLVAGCGNSNTDSNGSNQQTEHQSETEHDHDHADSKHEEKDHHDEDGHQPDHDRERADHFQGKKAETYDEAVANMKEANSKLKNLLAKDELSEQDFFQIHRMSYTMENALAKIKKESGKDYDDVAKNLESVHLASEKRKAQTVRQDGKKYLEGAKAILNK
ncbi:MAG: DUF6746 family protein [bacterium]